MGSEEGSGQGCPHVYNVLKCFTWKQLEDTLWKSHWRKCCQMQMLCKSFLILEESRGWHGQYILKKGFLHVNSVLKRFPVETIWRYTWKLRMGEGLTNADIEDVVTNILPKPQSWRPMSFSTTERSTKGEKSPCVYMSAPKLALRLFGCVLDESPCS